jgi:mRNA interferase MazF
MGKRAVFSNTSRHIVSVYWLDFGPCVVVQSDVFNRSRLATTVVCLITSNLGRAQAPGNVALKKGDANLLKASVVNVPQILTIDKTELTERIGKPPTTIDAIRSGLQLLFDRA